MMTDRDYRVVKSIGDHRLLTLEQVQKLHFPSYHTCWRRFNKEYKGKLVSKPFYIEVTESGSRTGVYRLNGAGKKLYKQLTGKDYKTPKFHLQYVPHLVETNNFLINYGEKNFHLEHKIGKLKIDAYFNNIALEVDLSEYETRKQFEDEYKRYQETNIEYLIIYSNRAEQIESWLGKGDKPQILYCRRNMTSVRQLKKYLQSQNSSTSKPYSSFHSS